MSEVLDKATVDRLLAELRRKDRKRWVFGSEAHGYYLNPPIPVSLIEEFETRHGITLPEKEAHREVSMGRRLLHAVRDFFK